MMKLSSIKCGLGRHDFIMKDISLYQDEARRVCSRCHLMQYGYEDFYGRISWQNVKPIIDKKSKYEKLPDNLKMFLQHGIR